MSSEFKVSIDRQNYSRETYSLLDWMGDLGGLIDALIIVTNYIVAPFAGYRLQAALTSSLFRFIESEPNKLNKSQSSGIARHEGYQRNLHRLHT